MSNNIIDEVKKLTGLSTNQSNLFLAQGIIEAFIGHTVDELESAKDLAWFNRAIAYQVIYMTDNKVFTTGYETIRQDDSTVKFNSNYALSPLAISACKNLSFNISIKQIQFQPFIVRTETEW